MLDLVNYATLYQYSPRGQSEVARNSRRIKDFIKAGRIEEGREKISNLIFGNQGKLYIFLNGGVTLIPVPRSSVTRIEDLWPAFEICKFLASLNLGTVATCLKRHSAIKKSSLCANADHRPTIAEQYGSMSVTNYLPNENITLVDDVLTMGRTCIAGASRLSEKFTNATIRLFFPTLMKGL